jgi:membrane peptidoglycan carboxypeptidase
MPKRRRFFSIGAFSFGIVISALVLRAYALDTNQSAARKIGPQRAAPHEGLNAAMDFPLAGESPLASGRFEAPGAQTYPLPELERVDLRIGQAGTVFLSELPRLNTLLEGRVASMSARNEFVFYTLNPSLQDFANSMIEKARAPHAALVAMDPRTGKILAIAGKSSSLTHPELHAGFPAASLFKIVTSAAAVERAGLSPETMVGFRGGTYTLNQWNYAPGVGRDTRLMSLSEALAKSCNPVFSRVALRFLSSEVLRSYARAFGFNTNLRFDLPLSPSAAEIPDSKYELGRTAAGFGDVTFSPIHAAAVMGALANRGLMLRPALIESVVGKNGAVVYQQQPQVLNRLMSSETAEVLLNMMEKTTTIGTSRLAFRTRNAPILPDIPVAAKTGTLRGQSPQGINNWFVAAAPADNPQIAIAVLVVDPNSITIKASQLGRQFIQKFFNRPVSEVSSAPVKRSKSKYKAKAKPKYRSIAPKKSSKTTKAKSSSKK